MQKNNIYGRSNQYLGKVNNNNNPLPPCPSSVLFPCNNPNNYPQDQQLSSTPLTQNKSKNYSDRFIPSRSNSNLQRMLFQDDDDFEEDVDQQEQQQLQQQSHNHPPKNRNNRIRSDKQERKSYSKMLQNRLLDDPRMSNQENNQNIRKMLRFNSDKKGQKQTPHHKYNLLLNEHQTSNQESKRQIASKPYKILDAPNLVDDFYLNLLDWSSQDQLAIGLDTQIFSWKPTSHTVNQVAQLQEDNSVCSVGWSKRSPYLLGYGDSQGVVRIVDINKNIVLQAMAGHQARVGSLAFNANLIATGSRDRTILVRDIRVNNNHNNNNNDYNYDMNGFQDNSNNNKNVMKYTGHKQEICGLKWSYDGEQLASGGNDNKLLIWSLRQQSQLCQFSQHSAAVKAIAWSPHQYNLLASGGGTADRTIRFWNTNTFQQTECIDTGSQVCNLVFSSNSQELVSTHGYSLNQIIVWKIPSMQKQATLTGHTMRVLYLAISPNGQTIVTGAGDETLRYWNIFPAAKNKHQGQLFPSNMDIR